MNLSQKNKHTDNPVKKKKKSWAVSKEGQADSLQGHKRTHYY